MMSVSLKNVMAASSTWQSKVAFDMASDDFLGWDTFYQDVYVLSLKLNHHPQRKWALCFDDSYYFAVAFMAAIHSGKELILPSNYQAGALTEISAYFDGILLDSAIEMNKGKILLPVNKKFITDNEFEFKQANFKELDLDNIRLTLFTSGSSGIPKAVTKNLKLLDAEIQQLESLWGEKIADCKIYSSVSHQHIYGLLFRVLWPLCYQRPFARQNVVYPEQIMSKSNANHCLISSPALLKRLGQQVSDCEHSNDYRAIFSSGGPLSFDCAQYALQLFSACLIEIYGSTETGGIAYRQQLTMNIPWQIFSCHRIRLNEKGCLEIQSPFIEFESAFNAWYSTSDLCELIDSTQFILKGRSDRILKIEEKRISLTEVERHLTNLTWINEAAILPINDEKRLYLAAVITLSNDGLQLLNDIGKGQFNLAIRKALYKWLEPVGVPRRFRVVDDIPVNSQGKRQMSQLKCLFE